MEDEAPSMKYAASGGQGENEEDEVAHWSGKKSHLKYHPNYQSKIILQKMRRMKSPTGQAKNHSNYHSKSHLKHCT